MSNTCLLFIAMVGNTARTRNTWRRGKWESMRQGAFGPWACITNKNSNWIKIYPASTSHSVSLWFAVSLFPLPSLSPHTYYSSVWIGIHPEAVTCPNAFLHSLPDSIHLIEVTLNPTSSIFRPRPHGPNRNQLVTCTAVCLPQCAANAWDCLSPEAWTLRSRPYRLSLVLHRRCLSPLDLLISACISVGLVTWLYGLQPVIGLCPRDSLGKKTGSGLLILSSRISSHPGPEPVSPDDIHGVILSEVEVTR